LQDGYDICYDFLQAEAKELLRQPASAAPAWGVPPAELSMQQGKLLTQMGHALVNLKQHIASECLLSAAAHFAPRPEASALPLYAQPGQIRTHNLVTLS